MRRREKQRNTIRITQRCSRRRHGPPLPSSMLGVRNWLFSRVSSLCYANPICFHLVLSLYLSRNLTDIYDSRSQSCTVLFTLSRTRTSTTPRCSLDTRSPLCVLVVIDVPVAQYPYQYSVLLNRVVLATVPHGHATRSCMQLIYELCCTSFLVPYHSSSTEYMVRHRVSISQVSAAETCESRVCSFIAR